MRVIKKYLNRKLYDTVDSKYVTIKKIADMIKNNIELKVLDNETGEDITNIVMAKVILSEEVNSKNKDDKKTLKDIMINPSELIYFYINRTKKNVKEEIEKILKKKEYDFLDLIKYFQGIYENYYKNISSMIDDKVNDLDEKIKEKINSVYPYNFKDIDNIKKEIKELKMRIKKVEGKIDE